MNVKKMLIRGKICINYPNITGPIEFFNGILNKNYVFERITIRKIAKDCKDDVTVYASLIVQFSDGKEIMQNIGSVLTNKITRRGVNIVQQFNCNTLPTCERFILVFFASEQIPFAKFEIFIIVKMNPIKIFFADECVVCLSEKPTVVYQNCLHQCLCHECSQKEKLQQCPICYQKSPQYWNILV